ncbi:MAG: methylmalonyl-CoA mutase small subunit [Bacteroidetes bacterium]|nr:methylmalonyl-CoA mutase small subunit [Bacteroidota bacterium]
MTDIDNTLTFMEEFPAISTEAWEAIIQKDLKGADYDKKLIWKTIDGFKLRPYYRQEDVENKSYLKVQPGVYPYLRGNGDGKSCNIQQDIWVDSPAKANTQAVNALSKGADSVCFMFPQMVSKAADLNMLLQNIDLTKTAIHFKVPMDHFQVFEWFTDYVKKESIDASQIHGSINVCPLSKLTATGNYYQDSENDFKLLAAAVKKCNDLFPHFRLINIEGHLFVDSGASVSQELAFSLAMASDYLAHLTNQGLTVNEIAPHIQFSFGIGSGYFLEIAKIRVARLLWSNIVTAYGGSHASGKVQIQSLTSRWNKTLYDPYVNMLRLTTEAMSAIIGGCNSLSIQPFDEIYGHTTDFAERIARNTQIILREEAQLDKTTDPAAGSYYIENITDVMAEHAWTLFQKIEKEGGYARHFLDGQIQEMIKETARKRDFNIAIRKETLLGTNQYPNAAEILKDEVRESNTIRFYQEAANILCKPLKMYRGAETFEALRMRTEKHTRRPKVFLLTIGNLNWRKARASFAFGFFACAGYEIIDNPGFENVDEGVKEAVKAASDIVVICSSDDEYAELAVPVYEQLKEKSVVVVAGMPACAEELKQQGLNNFIHVKSNVLEELQQYHHKLGIQ